MPRSIPERRCEGSIGRKEGYICGHGRRESYKGFLPAVHGSGFRHVFGG
jgi:hypothetical protein